VGWIKPIIEIMMSGNSQTVHYHLTQIFDTLNTKNKKDYHRLQPKILTANPEMDNASVENLIKLKEFIMSEPIFFFVSITIKREW
jgi:hypothetical protein